MVFILFYAISLSAISVSKQFSKTVEFQSNGYVIVKNINGNIKITSWEMNSVQIEADIKVQRDSRREAERMMERVEILVEQINDKLKIEPDYPESHGGGFWDWVFGSQNPPVVNFIIKVPRATNLTVESTNGQVTVFEIFGNADIGTVNGNINLEKMKGAVDAQTVNGSITVESIQFERNDDIDLNTTNGTIELLLPAEVKADIKASTVNGSIDTDFPLSVKGKILSKQIHGEINGGGGRIDLTTVNGSILIHEK